MAATRGGTAIFHNSDQTLEMGDVILGFEPHAPLGFAINGSLSLPLRSSEFERALWPFRRGFIASRSGVRGWTILGFLGMLLRWSSDPPRTGVGDYGY